MAVQQTELHLALTMLVMRWVHFRSLEMVTQRYLTELATGGWTHILKMVRSVLSKGFKTRPEELT